MPHELGIIDFFNGMLGKKEFFIPLSAAQYQFPHHYYGLTSAALLEDLFVDAAINYQKTERRDVRIERPEQETNEEVKDAKGEKGWDYKYQGENFSHKVGKDLGGIALLWDSTYKLPPDKTYSYPSPIVFVLAQYKNKNGKFISGESKIDLTPIAHYRSKPLEEGQYLIICEKKSGNDWKIISSKRVDAKSILLHDFAPFATVWETLLDSWENGTSVNQIDIFITKKRKNMKGLTFEPGSSVQIEFAALPGIYLFPKSKLQNVVVEKNNRGVLLPRKKVLELVEQAYETANFAFLPNWYTSYAGPRNVDLYQVQRGEYDKLNTAARH